VKILHPPSCEILSNTDPASSGIPRVAIVGGGPGGLLTGYLLQKKLARPVSITLFEASSRLGGKILTARFESAPVFYEAGAAEFYDYSPIADDSLKELVQELGLLTAPMGGNSVVINNRILGQLDDVELHLGTKVRQELERFYWNARGAVSTTEFYDSQGEEGPDLLAPGLRFDRHLSQIQEPVARQFIETLIHSDLAAESSDTNFTYGLHNYLMNDPGYMQLYGIIGGNQQLVTALANCLHAQLQMGTRVNAVRRLETGNLELTSSVADSSGKTAALIEEYDYVVIALPLDAVALLQFGGTVLNSALQQHLRHFDHPAHYLRISILFERPFWQGHLADSFCMLDQFNGCCLYDESSRIMDAQWGVLGWLIGGHAAREHAQMTDPQLIELALQSLPQELAFGKSTFIEGKVHRWIGSVNAMPGGESIMPLDRRHQPEPQFHSNLFLVGDYLFDSTINGVLDSADYVSDWIAANVNNIRF
jgi:monoamine oxidase